MWVEPGMCEKCIDIDDKTARYRRLTWSLTDQRTIDAINELIEKLTAEKAALHPDQE
jgi:hypothetical protein